MSANWRRAAQVTALTMGFALAGCGGGGGSGVASTPTPTPTPTPTAAAAANDDLIAPLVTESFANNSARGTATFPSSGGTTGSAAQASATIRYNAATNAYTLTTGGGSITFGPGNIDASLSTESATVYKRTTGSTTTDTLTLTKPGASGRTTYQYVGSAFWQHTAVGANSGSGAIDAIVYGVVTPTGATPTTGTASYPIDLIGAKSGADLVSPLAGTGFAAVDFGQNLVSITGNLSGGNAIFASSARITSGSNTFSGTFGFTDGGPFQGTLAGQFFGPAAAEIGASFAASATNGRVAVGTIMGRKGASPSNASFTHNGLVDSQLFTTQEAKLTFDSRTSTNNNDAATAFSGQAITMDGLSVSYDAASESYTLNAADRGRTFGIEVGATPRVGAETEELRFTRAPDLSYVRSARWLREVRGATGQSPFNYRIADFIFGMPSAAGQVPRTGKGGYALEFSGYAVDSAYLNAMLLSGSGALKVNFATGALDLNGSLDFGEDYSVSGRPRASASSAVTGTGTLSSSANSFAGSLSFGGIGNYTGQFSGQFFGPAAEEVGAQFTVSDGTDKAVGTFTGNQDAAIAATVGYTKITDMSGDRTFQSAGVRFVSNAGVGAAFGGTQALGSGVTVAYTASSDSYKLTAPDNSTVTFTPSHVVAGGEPNILEWRKEDGAVRDDLLLTTPRVDGVALSYTVVGWWSHFDGVANQKLNRLIVSGVLTLAGDMPRAGTATYSALVGGDAARSGMTYGLDGSSVTFSADFASNSVTTALTLAGTLLSNETVVTTFGTFNGTGTISSTGPGFSGTFAGSGATGAFSGAFFGPKALEMAYGWYINGADFSGGGLVVGVKQ